MMYSKELLKKLENAESDIEIISIAKENGVELTAQEAKSLFAELNDSAELSDDILTDVSGGFI